MNSARRVVITGLGLVTPLGTGVSHNWAQITSGKIGTVKLEDAAFEKLPCKVIGYVPRGKGEHELDVTEHFNPSELKQISPAISFSLVAATEAVNDAKYFPEDVNQKERTGVTIGMGMVDLDYVQYTGELLKERYSKVTPFFIPRILTNMAAGQVSIKFGFCGPNHSVTTACATGTHAIGDAFRMIKHGDADAMVCGGAESCITPLSIAGFCRLKALSTKYNDNPQAASRPFDSARDGFVMGEGSGIMFLEEYEQAKKRNAKIYAEILGYGLSGDGYHITSPREDGRGAQLAMERCLKEAGVNPSDVHYINAHATSTPMGDAIEVRAIREVFRNCLGNLRVSSTKGATGHLLGAAGAVEAIFTVLAAHRGVIPPTVNLEKPDVGDDVDLVPHKAKQWNQPGRRVGLSNSFGFGGTNACLCMATLE